MIKIKIKVKMTGLSYIPSYTDIQITEADLKRLACNKAREDHVDAENIQAYDVFYRFEN